MLEEVRRTFLKIWSAFSFFQLFLEAAAAWKVSKYGVFSGPYFPSFGLNTRRYFVSLQIQSECGKIQTRKNFAFGHISHSVRISWFDSFLNFKYSKLGLSYAPKCTSLLIIRKPIQQNYQYFFKRSKAECRYSGLKKPKLSLNMFLIGTILKWR